MSGNACGAHSPRSSVSHRVRTSVLAAGLLAGTLAAPARDAIAQPASPRPKWGFIDRAGKLVIEPKYDEVFPFSDGLALVKEGERYAFIDTLGRVRHAFDTTVHSVTPFAFGRALLWVSTRIGKRYGFLDTAGTWVIPPTYESASSFSDSLAVVDNQSYVDVNGKSVTIPGERVRSGSFSGGLWRTSVASRLPPHSPADSISPRFLPLASMPNCRNNRSPIAGLPWIKRL